MPYHTWPGELRWPEMRQWPGELQGAYKSGPRKKGFWPFSLAGWFYMDRNNAVWSGHIVAPLWIPHLPIFGKKLTPGPLGPKKGPKRPFWGPRRKNQNVGLRSHQNCGRFGTNLSPVALFVPELRSFSQWPPVFFCRFPKTCFGPRTPETGPDRVFALKLK